MSFQKDKRKIAPVGIPLLIEVRNPKKGSQHRCPCVIPMDCLEMDIEIFNKAYGPHILQAVFDLLQHKAFRSGLEKPKTNLIIAP
jgi:hypothetical protein